MTEVSLHSILDDARMAIDAGEAERAIGMGQYIVHYAPTMIEGHRLLGEAYLIAGQPEQAVGAFHKVLRADPEHIGAFYGLGLAHQRLQQGLEAIRAFEAALEIQPNLAELRTQLLRLYTETPGSTGQFRLSRSGLGRLYARGQMNGQAIDEFRAVLDDDPDRDDVRVALAETLWRDGQEDEATEWCRETIQRMPQLHKPTLILGYLQLAAGLPEGELLWRRATAQEPTLHTATQLFDILPPLEIEETRVPAYDAYAWQEQQRMAAAEAEQAAKDAEQAAISDQAPSMPAEIDRSAENELWASLEAPEATTSEQNMPSLVTEDALDAPRVDTSEPEWQMDFQTPGLSDDIVPFSFPDQQDESARDEPLAIAETDVDGVDSLDVAAPVTVAADDSVLPLPPTADALTPPLPATFDDESAPAADAPDEETLSDDDLLAQLLGFVDEPEDDPAQVMAEEAPAAPVITARDAWSTQQTDDSAREPRPSIEEFSFEAWQLEERTEPRESAQGAVQPFSLELDGSDDTDADFTTFSLRDFEPEEEAETAARLTPEPDDHQSLEQPSEAETSASGNAAPALPAWLRDDEPAQVVPADEAALPQWLRAQPVPNEEETVRASPPDIAPFSFADLGLDKADFTDLELREAEASTAAEPALTPFSLDDLEMDEQRLTQEDWADEADRADLGLSAEELAQFEEEPALDAPAATTAVAVSELPAESAPATTPGELADLGLSDEELARFEAPEPDLDMSAPAAGVPSGAGFDDDALVDFETLADTAALEGGEPAPDPGDPAIHDAETVPFDVAEINAATEPSTLDEAAYQASETPEPLTTNEPDFDVPTTPLPGQLSRLYERLETEPDNHAMRLAVARISEQMGEVERALEQYRQLIRATALLEPVVEDLQELVGSNYDHALLRRAHRLLGDAYMKQERLDEAMDEYSWT